MRLFCLCLLISMAVCLSPHFAQANRTAFEDQVDLRAARLIAVQHDGQIKTWDSFARTQLKFVNTALLKDRDPLYVYLDMMLRPEAYAGSNLIHIKKPFTRKEIIAGIQNLVPPEERSGVISDDELNRIGTDGLVSIEFVDHPAVRHVLAELDRDVMRSSREVQKVYQARGWMDAGVLERNVMLVPPADGNPMSPWYPAGRIWNRVPGAPQDAVHAGLRADPADMEPIPGISPETQATLAQCWQEVREGWAAADAERVSTGLNRFAGGLAGIAPELYPSLKRRLLEHWYYRSNKLTPTWILYMYAVAFLLMAIVYRWRWARGLGMSLFVMGLGLHTLSLGIRWYLAGRIPNSNMFEAITAAAWLGAVTALVMEYAFRKKVFANLPALCASVCAMLALMAGNFMPVALNSDIGTVMPVLDRTIWLYIHTNLIIWSYVFIGCAGICALLYLAVRGLRAAVPTTALRVLFEGTQPLAAGISGGGTAMLLDDRSKEPLERTGLGRTCDGMTMIFIELSFVTLWTGIILGAVWADVSWGRPWGWDPKEVFALNTWFIFLILIHIRLKVRDKALWTAILAVIGLGVMLFNWIAVNFVIFGLHSYA